MTIHDILRNRRGMALMFTLVTFLVVFIILTGVAIVANANLRTAQTSQEHTAAYFTAESGINTVSSDLRDLMNELLADEATVEEAEAELNTYILLNNNRRLNWNTINGELVYTDLSMSYSDIGNGRFLVSITSVGNIGPQQRELSMELTIDYNDGGHPIFSVKNAITALGNIIIGNEARIAEAVYIDGVRQPDSIFILGGPIATYSDDKCSIRVGKRSDDKAPPISGVVIPINTTAMSLNTYKANVVCPSSSETLNTIVGQFPDNGLKAISATGDQTEFPDLFFPDIPTTSTLLPQISINGSTLVDSKGCLLYTSPSPRD